MILALRQVVSDVQILLEGGTLVFLIGENRSHGLVMPGLVTCDGEDLRFAGDSAGVRAHGHAT